MSHVFISYVRENQKEVDRLCGELTNHGVNVWIDRNNISPGMRWRDAIQKAIEEGDFFIACFSKASGSKRSTHMNQELSLAVQVLAEYPTDRVWFIPVLLEECDVPARSIGGTETLLDIQWVSLHTDWDDGVQRILDVIQPISPDLQSFMDSLRSVDVGVRRAAAKALEKVAHNANAAVPALIEALEDEEDSVRQRAVDVLAKIRDPKAVPALIKALKDKSHDENIHFRSSVASALIEIGEPAVPALIQALKDEDGSSSVHNCAAFALARIANPEAQKAVEEYKKRIRET